MPPPISHEMTYEERQKKLNTVDPDLGNAFDWKKQMFNQLEALNPYLGSEVSSDWSFCGHSRLSKRSLFCFPG